MLRFVVCALVSALGLLSCTRSLDLPPPPGEAPRILDFSPKAAFSGDRVVVWGEHLDPLGNQLVFPGGLTAQAITADDGESDLRVEDGGIAFWVPAGIGANGKLVLTNTQGRSELTGDDFIPLGNGYPNVGTPVASLRFRHDPVGIVDREENVLMASSIFNLLVTDGKSFHEVPGEPLALRRSAATVDKSLLSVKTARGGMLVEVDTGTGRVERTSVESPVRELFILPPADGNAIARTLGVDVDGRTWFSTWTLDNGVPKATRRPLPFSEVLGAAALGPMLMVVATGNTVQDAVPAVYQVGNAREQLAWRPTEGATCQDRPVACEHPDGPIAVVEMPGGETTVAVSVASGDLVLLRGSAFTPEELVLISYAPIAAMAGGTTPGKLVFTKGVDGALFQYDLVSTDADWAVQLRGEPSVLDVNATLDEVAVGNRKDNAVDIVRASTGTWIGRIAFTLGVGSARGMQGGVVAPYTYDLSRYGGAYPLERMDLLMRNVGLVVSIDASNLGTIDHTVLLDDATHGAPLRLLVSDLDTLVVHESAIGLLEVDADGKRVERLVAQFGTGGLSSLGDVLEAEALGSEQVLLAALDRVRSYRWTTTGGVRTLGDAVDLRLPMGARFLAMAASGPDEVLIAWRTGDGSTAAGFFTRAAFAAGAPSRTVTIPSELGDFVGAVALRDGPSLLFGRAGVGGPRALTIDDLRGDGSGGVPSPISGAKVAGATPNGHFAVWLDEAGPEPLARLISTWNSREDGYLPFASYRLPGPAAGPACDPSGQWFFLPVPLLDQLEVVQ